MNDNLNIFISLSLSASIIALGLFLIKPLIKNRLLVNSNQKTENNSSFQILGV
ncbi:MAG: hypothetical protein JEZ08_01055 [Clostridiales bacterium]|nr:hypothetical protein [Clostridiales bacterium]